jgi:hypothetical protein
VTNGVAVVGVNGATALAGAGATGAGSIRETVAQDSTTLAGSSPGTAITAATMPAGGAGITGWLSAIFNVLGSPFQAGGSIGNTSFGVSSLPGSPMQATGGTVGIVAGVANIGGVALGPVTTAPSSTLTMTSATTAYTAGWMVATNATGTSVTVPSFAIGTAGASVGIPWVRLYSNDTVATSWGAQTMQVDLWNTAPTFAAGHGDRAAFLAATGSSAHSATFTCTMSAVQGDGTYAECQPNLGSMPVVTATGASTAIYWTLIAVSGSGVTGASGVWTLVPKVVN